MATDTKLWDADQYNTHSRLQEAIATHFLNQLKQRFSFKLEHPHLLDIGCGSGRVTQLILNSFPNLHITGVDASVEMIKFANQNHKKPQLSFHADRAETLETISTNSMDAIISLCCLHWVHDHLAAFKAMQRVLKINGWIGMVFAAETGFDDPIDRAYAQAILEEPWKSYFAKSSEHFQWNIAEPKILSAQLEKCGFKVLEMGNLNFDYSFADKESFESWILASFQQIKLLPQDLQESCARRIAELYLQITSAEQCVYKVDALMIISQKIN